MKISTLVVSVFALMGSLQVPAQTRIEQCGGSTTFNGKAEIAFVHLTEDVDISIRLHSTAQMHSPTGSMTATIDVDGKRCAGAPRLATEGRT